MKNSKEISKTSEDTLISCTGMPGNQSISRNICLRRYLLAKRMTEESANTIFDISRMSGLEICSSCLEGAFNAKRFKGVLLDNANYLNNPLEHEKKRK